MGWVGRGGGGVAVMVAISGELLEFSGDLVEGEVLEFSGDSVERLSSREGDILGWILSEGVWAGLGDMC
jgi:hypothetical protein